MNRCEKHSRDFEEFCPVCYLEAKPPVAGAAPCSADGCDHCDTFGGVKTYANQACLPINGKVACIDWCIHQLVAALNAGGIQTRACCCGHGRQPGRIDLADGRILTIANQRGQSLSALEEENAALKDAIGALRDFVEGKRTDCENISEIMNGALKLNPPNSVLGDSCKE